MDGKLVISFTLRIAMMKILRQLTGMKFLADCILWPQKTPSHVLQFS